LTLPQRLSILFVNKTNLNWLSELLKLTFIPNPKPNPNPKCQIFEMADLRVRNSGLVVFGTGAAGVSVELSGLFVEET